MFGRLGCALAHDHRGFYTSNWMAVQFPEGPRYDLGFMEFLLLVVLAAVFYALDQSPRETGFFSAAYCLSYGALLVFLDLFHAVPLPYVGGIALMLTGLVAWSFMTKYSNLPGDVQRTHASPRGFGPT